MRLIDADGLKPLRGVAIYATDEKTDTKIITTSVYRRADIDNAPTVEAIPIEWIEKWHKEEDRRLGDGWTHIEYPHSHSRMIADWREECEKQQSTTSE